MKHANQPTRDFASRRAFASFFALAMVVLVGAALVAFSALFALQARRTKTFTTDAQLRQMLLAGQTLIADRLGDQPANPATPPREIDLPLPRTLSHRDATLVAKIAPAQDANYARVTLNARLGQGHCRQTITYKKTAHGFSVTEARLQR